MIRQTLAAGISALALTIALPAQAQADDAQAADTPTMEFGTWGVDTTQLDPAVDPGADFNAYVNGKWVAANEIPADRSRYGAFDMLAEQSVSDVEKLVADLVASDPAPGTTARRVVDAYNAFLDTDAINAAGLAPAYPYLSDIFAAPDLTSLVGLFQKPGYPALVSVGVTIDDKDPDSHAAGVNFGGMGLPDRDYYLVDSERNLEVRAAYMEYLTFMLGQAGYEDPAEAARHVYAFEHRVAELEWDGQMLRNPEITYNELTLDELRALAPEFPVDVLLETGGFGDVERFLATQILPTDEEVEELGLTQEQMDLMGGGLPTMMELVTETPLANLKAWMAVRFLSGNAAVLPSEIDDAQFAFFGKVLGGQTEQRPRWKRAIGEVEGLLGERLGELYVARYFPPESKAQMEELVANLMRAMRADLAENEWMTEATVAEAVAKLEGFTTQIGYPDEFETYDGLQITPGTPLANRISSTAWAIADSLSELNEPVDRMEWLMLPQTVNAYYMPPFNQIVFPAAILQQPFFGPDVDPAVNYGAIGAVIGHEIGHGFDDQGSRYDGTGTLRNWWQPEDLEGFRGETGKLLTLLESYCIEDGELCLTSRGMGETLGDVVGLQMAYRAYRLSLNGEEAPVIDGLTADQRFFMGYAQVWRGMWRPEAKRAQMISGTHPPSDFRLNNAVRHVDAWYAAFDVGPEDALYLPPEQRVSIW
ncbi:M13 family metallopeptidase [Alteraurantiacibacter aquimixticola]|uniref:M13 family peptidase n=1 Tax=Alteraurantiacibacter aquimixticola TaxID=2489173 RepID=A0A4T3EZG7_9SPHN|nr:M13 family metallopeptidase [Alteraurantiacibacter aquimixticola]TIX48944.1 M13 family peptidase [Alteraurantiacibacter aquimixticola]